MPYGDGTGPWWGKGRGTGRGMGYCGHDGNAIPGLGFMSAIRRAMGGRGYGRGMGGGRGQGFGRSGYYPSEQTGNGYRDTNINLSEKESELADSIYQVLPKIDCGACGFGTCRACANAIATGKAPYNACRVLQHDGHEKIKKILEKR